MYFRSYFNKNANLVENSEINSSQNPVMELSYGTLNGYVSRYIFDVDLDNLKGKLEQGLIIAKSIQKHYLVLTNTIAYRYDLLGKKSYDGITQRTSSFDLDVLTLTDRWDEGSGYEFEYDNNLYTDVTIGAPNWFERKTDVLWTQEGGVITGSSSVASRKIGTQHFTKGNENIYIDVTECINSRLGITGSTGYTYYKDTTGFAVKFSDSYEALETLERQAVAFHARQTNTFYEPHILTIFDNTITDDRNYFFLDKLNELYLYVNVGNSSSGVTISGVTIIDYLGVPLTTISGSSIENVSLGIYKISLQIDSDSYPDAVLFTDRWTIIQNGKTKTIDQEFYLISQDNYYNFNLANRINFDNYNFKFIGIGSFERMKMGDIRRISLITQELYSNQNNFMPLDIEYRVFNKQGDKYQIDIIPWTKVNRTLKGYEFVLDTSWFIPQDYYLELRLNSGSLFQKKNLVKFTIVSDEETGEY